MTSKADRELLRDVEYFATELIRRVERLARVQSRSEELRWAQGAAMVRRVRGEARIQLGLARRQQERP